MKNFLGTGENITIRHGVARDKNGNPIGLMGHKATTRKVVGYGSSSAAEGIKYTQIFDDCGESWIAVKSGNKTYVSTAFVRLP